MTAVYILTHVVMFICVTVLVVMSISPVNKNRQAIYRVNMTSVYSRIKLLRPAALHRLAVCWIAVFLQ